MTFHTKTLLAALSVATLLGASPMMAQSTTDTTATEDKPSADGNQPGALGLSMGEPATDGGDNSPQIGQTYVREVSGDWEIRCVKEKDDLDPCQLYQLLNDQSGNSVAEISLFNLPEGQGADAGATIITPLQTLLPQQITLSVDGGQGKRYPFTFCTQVGCFARIGFTNADIDTFRKGGKAQIMIVPAADPTTKVIVDISLTGFTAGYKTMAASNDALPVPGQN